jgi:hypothetical protein
MNWTSRLNSKPTIRFRHGSIQRSAQTGPREARQGYQPGPRRLFGHAGTDSGAGARLARARGIDAPDDCRLYQHDDSDRPGIYHGRYHVRARGIGPATGLAQAVAGQPYPATKSERSSARIARANSGGAACPAVALSSATNSARSAICEPTWTMPAACWGCS